MLLTEGVYAPEVNVIPGLVERSFFWLSCRELLLWTW